MTSLPLWLCLLGLAAPLLQLSAAAQCAPDDTNHCIFRCNGTQFDISEVFKYPINITDDSRGYWYMFSPCKPYHCPGDNNPQGKHSAICQKADMFYNCGMAKQPIFLLDQYDPYRFKIEYPWGTTWRITVFNFVVDEMVDTPTVTFTGEEPYLQYNFLVVGKCLGQPYCQRGEALPLGAL